MVMLSDDSTPLSHVALDLGFASQSHFTRLFSAGTGMTPGTYRKESSVRLGDAISLATV